MSEQTFVKIRKIVAEELNVSEDDVTMEASFQDDLGADSLAQVELIMALEENFELDSIPDEDAEKIKSVKDAVEYIDARKSA
jgi:acyl carrier protein